MNEKEILNELLERSNFKQIEIAKKMGDPKSKINAWTKGKRTPKLSTLHKIANAVGLKILIRIAKK